LKNPLGGVAEEGGTTEKTNANSKARNRPGMQIKEGLLLFTLIEFQKKVQKEGLGGL